MNPLDVCCQRCGAKWGERCRNYKGQNKQTCPGRGTPEQKRRHAQEQQPAPDLFTQRDEDTDA